jgi:8-oxo-dGTP pyrophosphatase MutT (NUDIX family)
MKNKPLLKNKWESGSTREFYLSNNIHDESIVTCVFGIGFWDNKIVMTKTHRGWELPGGHVEEGETLQESLHREVKEESGAIVDTQKVVGYTEIKDVKEHINKATGVAYPLISQIIFYHITISEAPGDHQKGECIDSGIFPLDSEEVKNSHHYKLISIICDRAI